MSDEKFEIIDIDRFDLSAMNNLMEGIDKIDEDNDNELFNYEEEYNKIVNEFNDLHTYLDYLKVPRGKEDEFGIFTAYSLTERLILKLNG